MAPCEHPPMGLSRRKLTRLSRTLSDRRQTVELLGSWDNFAHPYRMRRDTARGRGVWVGCYTFDNIIFDGTELEWSEPRSGPLKQGGQYWYFYRLDDAEEYCDPTQPTTRDCPLLPGQALNHLEIPLESQVSQSPDLPSIMTYNPQDRYNNVWFQKESRTASHHTPPTKTSSTSASQKRYYTPYPIQSPTDCNSQTPDSPTLGVADNTKIALERRYLTPTGPTLRTKLSRLFKRRFKAVPEPTKDHHSYDSPPLEDLDMYSPTCTACTMDTPSLVTPPIDTRHLPVGLFPVDVYKSLLSALDRPPCATISPPQSPIFRSPPVTATSSPADTCFEDLDFLGEAIT